MPKFAKGLSGMLLIRYLVIVFNTNVDCDTHAAIRAVILSASVRPST